MFSVPKFDHLKKCLFKINSRFEREQNGRTGVKPLIFGKQKNCAQQKVWWQKKRSNQIYKPYLK
jgi:hypothetical protein